MSELSLSVLAIAIFTITMSALIGPVVGLSPLVPTGMTVLLLGLYGIDTAWWSGKGSARLLTWLQRTSPQYNQRLLHHEAGHFLAAHLLGIEILDYSLEPVLGWQANQAIEAGVVVAPLDITKQASEPVHYANLLERYSTVWMAGIAAEEYIYKEATGGLADLQQLRSVISNLANPELQKRWALLRARNLIANHQDAFQALVTQMQQKASVEACCAAIDQNLPK